MDVTVTIDEGQRQMLLLALAKLAIERPGWHWTLGELAETFSGREMFENFRNIHNPSAAFHAHLDVCRQCQKNPFNLCETGEDLLRTTVDTADRP